MPIFFGVILGAITLILLILVRTIFNLIQNDSDLFKVIRSLFYAVVIVVAANFSDYFCDLPPMKIGDRRQNVTTFFVAWVISGQGVFLVYIFKKR